MACASDNDDDEDAETRSDSRVSTVAGQQSACSASVCLEDNAKTALEPFATGCGLLNDIAAQLRRPRIFARVAAAVAAGAPHDGCGTPLPPLLDLSPLASWHAHASLFSHGMTLGASLGMGV
jgi:hypothetical protein